MCTYNFEFVYPLYDDKGSQLEGCIDFLTSPRYCLHADATYGLVSSHYCLYTVYLLYMVMTTVKNVQSPIVNQSMWSEAGSSTWSFPDEKKKNNIRIMSVILHVVYRRCRGSWLEINKPDLQPVLILIRIKLLLSFILSR